MMFEKKLRDYRKGATGALLDEYERALWDLKAVFAKTTEESYVFIADPETKDEDCRSIQTVTKHVIGAGYSYANYFRQFLSSNSNPIPDLPIEYKKINTEIDKMFSYTAETFEGKWDSVDAYLENSVINSGWGVTYNLEQLFEHAIVHILRHRRQIEKFLLKFKSERNSN